MLARAQHSKSSKKLLMLLGFACILLALLALVVPKAFANLEGEDGQEEILSDAALGLTAKQSTETISSQAKSSEKFSQEDLSQSLSQSLAQMAAPTDRSSIVWATSDFQWQNAGSYEVDWHVGKLTGDYDWHTSGVSFFTGSGRGIAVDITLLDQYPMGTQIELTMNGRSVVATVCDCGDWWSSYGHDYVMFDLMGDTCNDLGWDYETRNFQGIGTVTWRVVSYG